MSRHLRQFRAGQSLVEFAVVALVLYMLLAAILTFGHALYVSQGLQGAVDLAAREISRAPLPADETFEAVLDSGALGPSDQNIFDDDFLVFDLNSLGDQNFFTDIVPTWPRLNQQLATLMIVDRPDFDGDGSADANLIRYPGALLEDASTPTGYTVGIPLVESRSTTGVESIRWIPVVEEIDTENSPADDSGANPDPFRVSSNAKGVVALRINYPFQSASMSSFRRTTANPYDPTIGNPNVANDGGVVELNAADRPGALVGQPLEVDRIYAGTYGGKYGLGVQGAMGMTVRPYRRVISSQAIYRREVFSN
ncbi:MAG: TadE family protein [Planctomycetota bacterium]|nr:TadE family protein [Planctomycetota bacterium]